MNLVSGDLTCVRNTRALDIREQSSKVRVMLLRDIAKPQLKSHAPFNASLIVSRIS